MYWIWMDCKRSCIVPNDNNHFFFPPKFQDDGDFACGLIYPNLHHWVVGTNSCLCGALTPAEQSFILHTHTHMQITSTLPSISTCSNRGSNLTLPTFGNCLKIITGREISFVMKFGWSKLHFNQCILLEIPLSVLHVIGISCYICHVPQQKKQENLLPTIFNFIWFKISVKFMWAGNLKRFSWEKPMPDAASFPSHASSYSHLH